MIHVDFCSYLECHIMYFLRALSVYLSLQQSVQQLEVLGLSPL